MFSMAATEARLMIETTLRATSEKLAPSRKNLRRPAQLPRAEGGEEVLDGGAACQRREVALDGLHAGRADRQHLRRIVEMGSEPRQPLVAHQHEEPHLRQVARLCRIEPA